MPWSALLYTIAPVPAAVAAATAGKVWRTSGREEVPGREPHPGQGSGWHALPVGDENRPRSPMDRTQKIALASALVGAVVLALKYAAYRLTGSVALYSDALESVINVVAAGGRLLALRVSAKPADREHPYGHHKAEYFSAVLEGVLIVLAALSILREAYLGYLHPRPLDPPALGLAVNARRDRRQRGLVLVADPPRAPLALAGAGRRRPAPADRRVHLRRRPRRACALVVAHRLARPRPGARRGWSALNILWAGWGLMRESVGGLMDEAASPEVVGAIRALIRTEAEGALEAHDLRTRHAGRVTFVEFHLVVPGDMRVAEAHGSATASRRP